MAQSICQRCISKMQKSWCQKLGKQEQEKMSCGCGRSPTGKCVGWHSLSEEEYLKKKAIYEAKHKAKENE